MSLLLLLLVSHFSCVRLCATPWMAAHPPVPGILKARTLEWVTIAFSNAWEWKVRVKLLSHVRLLATPWTVAHQAPPSMGFSRQEYWSGVSLPSPQFHIRIKRFGTLISILHWVTYVPYLCCFDPFQIFLWAWVWFLCPSPLPTCKNLLTLYWEKRMKGK